MICGDVSVDLMGGHRRVYEACDGRVANPCHNSMTNHGAPREKRTAELTQRTDLDIAEGY